MEKQFISYSEYLQLLGLLVLAAEHNRRIKEIERAAAKLLDEPGDDGYFGHISDEVWDTNPNADSLLEKLKIEVEEKR